MIEVLYLVLIYSINWPLWFLPIKCEIAYRIRAGNYTPKLLRRVEIPNPDGWSAETWHSYRHRPNHTASHGTAGDTELRAIILWKQLRLPTGEKCEKSAKDAIGKVKEYAEQGYTHVVSLNLSKYFDTLNRTILLSPLRRDIKDERVIQMVKRYLKSGVMENGVVMETEVCSPQGGNLSPPLANIYLNEFDQEYKKRGVLCIRYEDDIVLLAKSERAAISLLETSTKYLGYRTGQYTQRQTAARDIGLWHKQEWSIWHWQRKDWYVQAFIMRV